MSSGRKSRADTYLYILLVLAAFTALIMIITASIAYASAQKAVASSNANKAYCTDYYDAETIATEILSNYQDHTNFEATNSDNRRIYHSARGDILVFKTDSIISFHVPISGKEHLVVMAQAAGSDINLIQWTIKEDL